MEARRLTGFGHTLGRRLARTGLAGLVGLAVAAGSAAGCDEGVDVAPQTPDEDVAGGGPGVGLNLDPEIGEAPVAVLRRLKADQYRNTLADWFGEALVLPASLEPDVPSEGLYAVGASVHGVSALGVERYHQAAKSIASQLVDIVPLRDQVVTCEPQGDGLACLGEIVETWGLRLWRRPLTTDEVARVVGVGEGAIEALGEFDEGVRYAMMALLTSPKFLYVHAEGSEDLVEGRPYDDYEMATRVALFLWSAGPDQWLLDQAAAGKLTDDDGLREVVDTMLADPRARRGLRTFTDDWLELDRVFELSKDPEVFTYLSADIGPKSREETLLLVEHLAFDTEADFRTLMTTTTTFVDARLAALYGVQAGSSDGYAMVQLPDNGPRAGLLGHVSVLAAHATPNRSSPTERGIFVRERLLCQHILPPPAGVDTTLPEGSMDAPTMRERLAIHLEEPSCAGCHALTDLIGLALENFDGLGGFRMTENDVVIDASGRLDGVDFGGPRELGQTIAEHPGFVPCIVDTMWAYANGRERSDAEAPQTEALVNRFADAGYRLPVLLEDIVMSQQFRRVGAFSDAPTAGDDGEGEGTAEEGAE